MGIAIPQVITNRSGAQVIDGSLKFDILNRTTLIKNSRKCRKRRTWTWAAWVKRNKFDTGNKV